MNVSFLAVLQNGEHIIWTNNRVPTENKGREWLRQAVVSRLTGKVAEIRYYMQAVGKECQMFVPSEVREMYFS